MVSALPAWCTAPGLLLAVLVAGGGGCRRPPESVAIGYASGVDEPNAGSVAQAVIDAAGRPNAPRIEIVTGDTGRWAQSAATLPGEVNRALRLSARPDLVAVVGPGGSREALQSAPIYREAGIPHVIPTATSRQLRDLGPGTYALAPNDSLQGDFIGAFAARDLQARRALLFYVPDEYGVGLAAGGGAALAARNITLLDQVPVQPNMLCQPRRPTNPYDDVVRAALLSGVPDVVILATRTPEGACLARAVRERVPGARFIAGDGVLVQPLFTDMAGPAIDSLYVVAFWVASAGDPRSMDFAGRFRAATRREPRSDDAMFFDATMLLAEAVREAGPSREAVRGWLESLGRSRPPYSGVTGPIAFTPDARRPMLMTRVRQGRPEPVPFQ